MNTYIKYEETKYLPVLTAQSEGRYLQAASSLALAAVEKRSADGNNPVYNDPADFAPHEVHEYFEQAPHLLNATTFAATVLQRGEVAFDLPSSANCFLTHTLEESFNTRTSVKGRDWQILLPAAAT